MKKRPKSDISLKHIAKELELSPSTVSRVLNNYPYVNETTRSRVMKLVAKIGYKRNIMASSLRTNKSKTIGMIVPRISMFVHAQIITAIQNILHKQGYNLIICQSNESVEMEKELAQTLFASMVDAVIVACTLFTTDFSHFNILVENNIPVFFYDRVPTEEYPAAIIKGDDFRGGYLAGSHLIEVGCKDIAHISGPLTSNLYRARVAGFKEAMEQHGFKIGDDRIFYHELTSENARRTMRQLFETRPFPDGIFAANDLTALTVHEFARERGIAVPRDLKIVGYSNDPSSSLVTPSITTIEQFPERIADTVAEELLRFLRPGVTERPENFKPITIPVELVRRMST
jgi:LacI family transcriptional regulator